VNLESCLLIFGNWFGITEMATDKKVKSTKNVPKPPKEKFIFLLATYGI
jgi:hypothetical protein